jgi:hypothetical protein
MRDALRCAATLLGIIALPQAEARDCTVSKEFHLKQTQVLAGVLQDPDGTALSGMEMELLSGATVVNHLVTNSVGAYDFGQVSRGKYRIHVTSAGGDRFCVPKAECGQRGCVLQPRLSINLKNAVLVH